MDIWGNLRNANQCKLDVTVQLVLWDRLSQSPSGYSDGFVHSGNALMGMEDWFLLLFHTTSYSRSPLLPLSSTFPVPPFQFSFFSFSFPLLSLLLCLYSVIPPPVLFLFLFFLCTPLPTPLTFFFSISSSLLHINLLPLQPFPLFRLFFFTSLFLHSFLSSPPLIPLFLSALLPYSSTYSLPPLFPTILLPPFLSIRPPLPFHLLLFPSSSSFYL